MLGEALDCKLVRLGDVFLSAAADVFGLSLVPQEAFLQLGDLRFSFGQGRLLGVDRRVGRGVGSRFLLRCRGLGGLARGFVGGRGILARRVLLRVFHVAESRLKNKAIWWGNAAKNARISARAK